MRIDKWIGTRAAIAVSVAGCVMVTSAAAAPLARLATPAAIGTEAEFEFLWQPEPDNATQIYLHVANMAWEPSRSQVQKVYPKLRSPEWDFPILVFMAHESRSSLQAVWKLRADGMAWTDIMGELKIKREKLILEPKGQGGPPHGKAHGYWREHASESLTDDDIFYWANIHALTRYFGTLPAAAIAQREEGRAFKAIAATSFMNGQGKARQYMQKDVERAGMEPARPPSRTGKPPKGAKKDD